MRNRFLPTKQQKKAFDRVRKAMAAATKAGLVFYGKQGSLVAYTKYADDYVEEHGFDKLLGNGCKQIPTMFLPITDSGADDYPSFKRAEDDPDFEFENEIE